MKTYYALGIEVGNEHFSKKQTIKKIRALKEFKIKWGTRDTE